MNGYLLQRTPCLPWICAVPISQAHLIPPSHGVWPLRAAGEPFEGAVGLGRRYSESHRASSAAFRMQSRGRMPEGWLCKHQSSPCNKLQHIWTAWPGAICLIMTYLDSLTRGKLPTLLYCGFSCLALTMFVSRLVNPGLWTSHLDMSLKI